MEVSCQVVTRPPLACAGARELVSRYVKFDVPQHKILRAQGNGRRRRRCYLLASADGVERVQHRLPHVHAHPSDPLCTLVYEWRMRMPLKMPYNCVCKCRTCNQRAEGDSVERGRGEDLGAETRESTSPHLLGAAQMCLPIIAFEGAHRRLRVRQLQYADTVTDQNPRRRFAAAFASAAHSPTTGGALPPPGNLPFD